MIVSRNSEGAGASRRFFLPQPLEPVELAHFWAEDVDNHIARIDQNPIAMRHALNLNIAEAKRLQTFQQMLRDRPDMPVGAAGCDDHGISEGGFVGEVDGDEILRLVLIEAFLDCLKQRARGWCSGTRRRRAQGLGCQLPSSPWAISRGVRGAPRRWALLTAFSRSLNKVASQLTI